MTHINDNKTENRMEINKLVAKAKDGNSEAFGLIYDDFAQRIFRYIRIKVQNRPEAEDILQEVFVKAYKGLQGLTMEDLNFSAWLYRIASNTINDHFRKKYRTPEILGIDEHFDIASKISVQKEAELHSDAELVKLALKELPEQYQQVLELRFIQDFNLSEIAQILKKSNLSVRLLQHRALKKIKIILNSDGFIGKSNKNSPGKK